MWNAIAYAIIFIAVLYICNVRKKWQQLDTIAKYWKAKDEEYAQRSNEGAETDSQDSCNHGVWPMDPNV